LDNRYPYDELREIVVEFGFTAHIPAKGKEAVRFRLRAGQGRSFVSKADA